MYNPSYSCPRNQGVSDLQVPAARFVQTLPKSHISLLRSPQASMSPPPHRKAERSRLEREGEELRQRLEEGQSLNASIL